MFGFLLQILIWPSPWPWYHADHFSCCLGPYKPHNLAIENFSAIYFLHFLNIKIGFVWSRKNFYAPFTKFLSVFFSQVHSFQVDGVASKPHSLVCPLNSCFFPHSENVDIFFVSALPIFLVAAFFPTHQRSTAAKYFMGFFSAISCGRLETSRDNGGAVRCHRVYFCLDKNFILTNIFLKIYCGPQIFVFFIAERKKKTLLLISKKVYGMFFFTPLRPKFQLANPHSSLNRYKIYVSHFTYQKTGFIA